MTKKCPKCKRELALECFSKDKSKKDGLRSGCKDCRKEYTLSKKDELVIYRKNYHLANKERRNKYSKKYHEKNKIKIHEDKKKYMKNYSRMHTKFNSFGLKLTVEESPISDEKGYMLVKCAHCHQYFYPTHSQINNRINALNSNTNGESRIYCSEECKHSCSLYRFDPSRHSQPGTKEWVKKQNKAHTRDPNLHLQWREMVLERDNYKCISCGSTEKLEAHHKEGILWNPIESADIDMGVTLCENCHKKAHEKEFCSYINMECK